LTALEALAMPHLPASPALSRYTVLDLTRVRAGPTCVRQLADWGANVIKVELPDRGPDGHALGGPRAGSDFQNLHRNKRSLPLNLKAAEGREILLRLVERADVVVENFRPDVKTRLKIGYEDLEAVNPRIVLASISGFGQDGPYAERPGFDQIAQGMGGLMSITGLPGQGPVRVGIPVADLCAGLFAAQGILIALLEREVSGAGQWIQTSLLQAQVFMLDFQAARWLVDREVPKQAGNNHPTSIPTGVFATSDGHINIAVAGQEIWRRFCQAIGHVGLTENPAYAEPADRSRNRDALNAELAAILRRNSSAQWIGLLNQAGVPCGPINTIDEVFADPQVRHLGIAQAVRSHERGDVELVGQPVVMSRTPSRIRTPPPLMGEHTEEILRELGYDDDRIARLRAAAVI
jgi:crotonobetainyl-CoA:carnitine CoA-transferase CaiB-like acyl-CoA transferase